jgi:hypothetical protein
VTRYATWLLVAAVVLVALGLGALAALPYVVDTPRVQALIAQSASQALGRSVTFAAVSLSVFPRPAVRLRGLAVAEDPAFDTAPFLRLDDARLALRVRPLVTGRVEFGDLVLREPVVTLLRDRQGRWNVATLGPEPSPRAPAPSRPPAPPAAAPAVLATRIRVADGLVTYASLGAAAPSGYRLEGVDLTIEPARRPIAFEGAARLEPGRLGLTVREGTLALDPARGLLEAPLRAELTLESARLRDLAAAALGPAPVLDGRVRGTLAVGGSLGRPTATGDVAVDGLAVTHTVPECPGPKERTLTLDAVRLNAGWDDVTFTARPATATLAGGTVRGNVVATTAPARVEVTDLAVTGVPFERVLVDFLCQGYAVTGPLDLTGRLAFDPTDPHATLAGTGQLRVGSGRVVGPRALALVDSVLRTGGVLAGLLGADVPPPGTPLRFDSITATFRVAGGVVTTPDLVYASPELRVTLAGTYALPTSRMNFDVAVRHARGELRAQVTGTPAAPAIRPLPSSLLRELERGAGERGLEDLLRRFR